MYDYHETAVLWEQWVEAHEAASSYVDNVIAHDDHVSYRFDGFMRGIVFFKDGYWYDVSDTMEVPEDLVGFEGCKTLEELWARHCALAYDPYEFDWTEAKPFVAPEFDVMGAHMGRNA